MKKTLSLLLALMMIFALLAGCSETAEPADDAQEPSAESNEPTEPTEPSDNTATEEPQLDEVQYYNINLAEEPGSLNHLINTTLAGGTILTNVLEPLVRNEWGEIVPAGCSDYEISEDGLTWTFHLRENYWNDGVQVTAQDYAYTLQMCATPATGYPYAADMYVIKNFEPIIAGEMDISELGVHVVDDLTLEIELSYVCPALLNTLSFMPLRQDVYEEWGERYGSEAETLVCCGPFVLDEWTHNSTLRLSKNEQYWDAETVKLEDVTYHIVTEEVARYNMLDNGSLDSLSVSDVDYIARFSAREDLNAIHYSSARTVMMVFNNEDPAFSNRNIRLAFSLAFPREDTATYIFNDLNEPAWSLTPPPVTENGVAIRDATGEPLKQLIADNPDPQAVLIEGLKELGLSEDPADFEFELYMSGTNSKMHTMGEYWQQALQEALGCTITLRYDDYAIFSSNCSNGDFQVGFLSWGANADPSYMFNLFASTSSSIPGKHNNPEYDELALAVQRELDYEKRLEMFAELDNMLVTEDVAICPVVFGGGMTFRYDYVYGVDESAFTDAGVKYVYTAGRES